MKKCLKETAVIGSLAMLAVAAVMVAKPKEPTAEETVVKEDVPNEEAYCQQVQLIGITKVHEPIQAEANYFEVPLSEEIQDHIFAECEKYNIPPEIIIAMIERESRFTIDAIGDNGNSLGLMQIQPKWHQARMNKLGCSNLLDPYQNITVGIDIVAELKATNDNIYWVLMAYNSGTGNANKRIASGNYSEYALEVVQRAAEIERRCD